MHQMTSRFATFSATTLLASSLVLLSACGGGGSGSTAITDTSVKTGVFIDAPVKGLAYKTPTQSGVTNEKGEFKFIAGETVTFTIDGVELGSTKAETRVLVTAISQGGIHIAQLLQTLDTDVNPDLIDVSKIKLDASVKNDLTALIANGGECRNIKCIETILDTPTLTTIQTNSQVALVHQSVVSEDAASHHVYQSAGSIPWQTSDVSGKVFTTVKGGYTELAVVRTDGTFSIYSEDNSVPYSTPNTSGTTSSASATGPSTPTPQPPSTSYSAEPGTTATTDTSPSTPIPPPPSTSSTGSSSSGTTSSASATGPSTPTPQPPSTSYSAEPGTTATTDTSPSTPIPPPPSTSSTGSSSSGTTSSTPTPQPPSTSGTESSTTATTSTSGSSTTATTSSSSNDSESESMGGTWQLNNGELLFTFTTGKSSQYKLHKLSQDDNTIDFMAENTDGSETSLVQWHPAKPLTLAALEGKHFADDTTGETECSARTFTFVHSSLIIREKCTGGFFEFTLSASEVPSVSNLIQGTLGTKTFYFALTGGDINSTIKGVSAHLENDVLDDVETSTWTAVSAPLQP
ncbi:MAG: hypothetical protein QJT81_15680 [Candidatus Thiothrix putei]|uniref:Uncharacterized protein n=1 Tax=Candidatus Thiothrix putei TaxID=3080811 RepID=A0AA95KIB0_9GAMM|nr:MAG: hypothetical protein QJT81_15680 [Candidatus Thiothrix putei]